MGKLQPDVRSRAELDPGSQSLGCDIGRRRFRQSKVALVAPMSAIFSAQK